MSWSLFLPSRRSTGAPSCSPPCLWVSMSTIPSTVMSAPWWAPWGGYRDGVRWSLITPARHRTRMWLSLQEPHQHSLPTLGHCWSSTKYHRYERGGGMDLEGLKFSSLVKFCGHSCGKEESGFACLPNRKKPTTDSSWNGGFIILVCESERGMK